MAKETGMAWTRFDVDDEAGVAQDLLDATNSLEWSTPRAVIEVTGLGKSAFERLHGLADFSSTPSFTFDDATADSPHDVFKDLSNVRTYGITVSAQILNVEVLVTDYAYTRADDGSLKGTAPVVLANGVIPTWTT